MLKGMRNIVVLAAAASCLSGCHLLHSARSCSEDKSAYLQASSVPPLRVPVGVDPPDTKSALQIPALNEPALPPRALKAPCLDEPPKFTEPRGPRPPPAP